MTANRKFAKALTVANVPLIKLQGTKALNVPLLPRVFIERFCENVLLSHTYRGHGRMSFTKVGSGTDKLITLVDNYWSLLIDRMVLSYLLSIGEPSAMVLLKKGDNIGPYDQYTLELLDRALSLMPMSGMLVDKAKQFYPILISLKGVILIPSGLEDVHKRIDQFTKLLRDSSQWMVILQGAFGRPAVASSASVEGVRAALINYGYDQHDQGEYYAPEAEFIEFGYPYMWFKGLTAIDDLVVSDPSFFYSRFSITQQQVELNLRLLADECVPVDPVAGGTFEEMDRSTTGGITENKEKGK